MPERGESGIGRVLGARIGGPGSPGPQGPRRKRTGRYVESPTEWEGGGPAVFLAGGITDCPDWQAHAARLLATNAPDVTVLNPRRADFPIGDPDAAPAQIAWEFRHLRRATVVLFWLAAGPSPQPIALYELGRHAALCRPLAVGVESGYPRAIDVCHQLAHARPDVSVYGSLWRTCQEALNLVRAIS